MTRERGNSQFLERNNGLRRPKFGALLHSSDPSILSSKVKEDHELDSEYSRRNSSASVSSPPFFFSSTSSPMSGNASPYLYSPWNQTPSTASPYVKSPWTQACPHYPYDHNGFEQRDCLVGSLVREEGHVYSLAASGELLYTGSDSKNIRVWKNLREFSGFKANSGLVKAIIISGDKVFTGHQDGKIRVWRLSSNGNSYKRVGRLPTAKDYFKSSINPKNYVEVRRHRNVPWIKHFDAVSSMSLDEEQGILYSGSWDKTLKVWRLSDYKCLESINAHEDAINSVAVGFDGLVFTGSADGTVKAWRRELVGKATKHVLVQTLLKQEKAVTALAVSTAAGVLYCGSSDGLVNYWEKDKHFLVHVGMLRGHKLAVLCLAVGGNLVLSGSADKSICVWRRDEGVGGDHTCLSVLTGHTGPVKCLAVEKDGHQDDEMDNREGWIVYSGSLDKSVKVWRLSDRAPEYLKHLKGV